MSGLICKCALLVLTIHGLRSVGRRVGPRFSGLILGLPSTSAVVLALTAWERGERPALQMSEASMLGLSAAIAIPLVYARLVARGWRLRYALALAIAVYGAIAAGVGVMATPGAAGCLAFSGAMMFVTAHLAKRTGDPKAVLDGEPARSPGSIGLFRTLIPVVYLMLIGIAQSLLRPGLAGLVGSFPSLSVVMLVVLHLEAGPGEATRFARALPIGNLSTLVYLAVFRFGTPLIGLGWAVACGYMGAIAVLVVIDGRLRARLERLGPVLESGRAFHGGSWIREWASWRLEQGAVSWIRRAGARHSADPAFRRRAGQAGFAPRFEVLRC